MSKLRPSRGPVDLEVPGVDDGPDRRSQDQGDRVRDRVRHADELDPDLADPQLRPGAIGRKSGCAVAPNSSCFTRIRSHTNGVA